MVRRKTLKYFAKGNSNLESKIDRFFSELSCVNESMYHGKLSIILLGSMSRGEASWLNENGYDKLVSDIEFFTVYPASFTDFNHFNEEIEKAKNIAFNIDISSLFHVDNTYIPLKGLSKLERKLITYDALYYGKCVVGPDVIKYLPYISLRNINLFDIKDIITHRAISVLYFGRPLKDACKIEEYRYSLAKNSLDLMTVLLVKNGVLVSGFKNRLEEVCKLNISDQMKEYFSYCLAIKLGINRNKEYSIEEMEKLFYCISDDLYKTFKIPVINIIRNLKHILRRCLGVVKRVITYKHMVVLPYYPRLQKHLIAGSKITTKDLLDNLVLNGYPLKTSSEDD